jgi:hypothetical protein
MGEVLATDDDVATGLRVAARDLGDEDVRPDIVRHEDERATG